MTRSNRLINYVSPNLNKSEHLVILGY
ncbi:uncharacterized protein METZ01_LOCUS324433 [marine metagenome]|uniref:Uncharacterized protein n=1 Tax=marine metagenome TaxID=408172 RepID=A0A382PDV7_9ZZZZ